MIEIPIELYEEFVQFLLLNLLYMFYRSELRRFNVKHSFMIIFEVLTYIGLYIVCVCVFFFQQNEKILLAI